MDWVGRWQRRNLQDSEEQRRERSRKENQVWGLAGCMAGNKSLIAVLKRMSRIAKEENLESNELTNSSWDS